MIEKDQLESESSMASRFRALLADEIKRMSDRTVTEPPADKNPLTLDEYRTVITEEGIQKPTPQQIDNFLRLLQNEVEFFATQCRPGFKVVPALMLAEHGYAGFDDERVRMYGHLYAYTLTPENLTARADLLAYMDAVLPAEILSNAVAIPEKFLDPTAQEAFYAELRNKVEQLIEKVYGQA